VRKFLIRLSFFAFPILVIFVTGEILLRNIPNDYASKKNYLERNASIIHVLCLGSSHAYYDLNPARFNESCYNAGYVSQTVEYDYKIYQKYNKQLISLKWIILPISYFTLFSEMENSPESWRIKDYSIYLGLNGAGSRFFHYEMLSYNLSINLKRITDYYFNKSSNITCSDLGFGIDHALEKNRNLDSTGHASALRHTKYMNERYLNSNEEILENLIELADRNGVRVIIFTPPAWHSYTDNIDKRLLKITMDSVDSLCRKYSNVSYRDYLTDSTFRKDDFLDADHLNGNGAGKLSDRLDSLIHILKTKD
jgi:hypothetical protein